MYLAKYCPQAIYRKKKAPANDNIAICRSRVEQTGGLIRLFRCGALMFILAVHPHSAPHGNIGSAFYSEIAITSDMMFCRMMPEFTRHTFRSIIKVMIDMQRRLRRLAILVFSITAGRINHYTVVYGDCDHRSEQCDDKSFDRTTTFSAFFFTFRDTGHFRIGGNGSFFFVIHFFLRFCCVKFCLSSPDTHITEQRSKKFFMQIKSNNKLFLFE
jgi:hypothetical protein